MEEEWKKKANEMDKPFLLIAAHIKAEKQCGLLKTAIEHEDWICLLFRNTHGFDEVTFRYLSLKRD
jgi:hypothetical protein